LNSIYPSYLESFHNESLSSLIEKAFGLLESCTICPRKCKVNRLKGEVGFCKTALRPKVYSFMPHHGEEPPISGSQGSGTIFFSCCNMSCLYCQNYEFSQLGKGREVDFEELAGFMLNLQKMGCHNINLVTPTHVMPQILKSLQIAASGGLKIPLVYNTGGYELAQAIGMLRGIVDIYLADMRYGDAQSAQKYSAALDYPRYNRESVKEMHRQVGIAKFDSEGIIKKGLIIRHLVLPGGISGTQKVMKYISEEVSKDTYISLMSQYTPYYRANEFPELSRRIYYHEYEQAQAIMEELGLCNGWIQEAGGLERFAGVHIKPNLNKENDT